MRPPDNAPGLTSKGQRARIAIDLGAESCRVSLLRLRDGSPHIELIHRIANGPVQVDGALRWPFDAILSGLEDGLRKAAVVAPEGVASIAVDGWAVDYVRLDADGAPVANPFCYRDERTVAAKEAADCIAPPEWMFAHTGTQPLRINTIYQLLADQKQDAAWVNLPEYVLCWLGGRRVAEYTNATHTGLVDLATGDWSQELIERLSLSRSALPLIAPTGTVVGKVKGRFAELDAFRDTDLIAPACHDTASAIASIPSSLDKVAYICSGTWSLVGTRIASPIATAEAMQAGFTNQGAAGGGFQFHTNVNGLWMVKRCLESWRNAGRPWTIEALVAEAERRDDFLGTVDVDAAPLLLDEDMPTRLNEQLQARGHSTIEDCAGNEPLFARTIFESLAARYVTAIRSLEKLLGERLLRIHILGGGAQNQLLTRLTAERTGLPVETGHTEGSTIGNFAVQLAAAESTDAAVRAEDICRWARILERS